MHNKLGQPSRRSSISSKSGELLAMCLAERSSEDHCKKTAAKKRFSEQRTSERSASEETQNETNVKESNGDQNRYPGSIHQNLPSMKDMLDFSKPWVLVPNGSFMGYFDFVPEKLRVGPWSLFSTLYLAAMVYLSIIGGIQYYSEPIQKEKFEYYEALTPAWCYNFFGFGWTFYVAKRVFCAHERNKYFFATYTLQSWTVLMLRHGLCVIAPFIPSLALLSESLRLPSLVQATVTFAVWNFALMPCIAVGTKDPKKRRNFFKFCFGFNLFNLHGLNIIFAAINGVWGSPARAILHTDVYVALLFFVLYSMWYFLVLDRLGIHFYFIFSPRSIISIVTWTIAIALTAGASLIWKKLILEYGNPQIIVI